MKQTEILTHATHVNGWEPTVYMICMSQNFRLFHASNLSVRNFRIFLLMYSETASPMSPSDAMSMGRLAADSHSTKDHRLSGLRGPVEQRLICHSDSDRGELYQTLAGTGRRFRRGTGTSLFTPWGHSGDILWRNRSIIHTG